MHVSGVTLDLNWFLQLILTVFLIIFGLLYLVKNTASKYFEVDANFEASGGGEMAGKGGGDGGDCNSMSGGGSTGDAVCVVCGNLGTKKCSRCKAIRYCSPKCQEIHWKAGHKTKCKDFLARRNSSDCETANADRGSKASTVGSKSFSSISLIPSHRASKPIKQPKDILFPYDEFLDLFFWDKHQFHPCGLLNCGNSCYANVVLQCLSFTRPLFAFLMERGHRNECVRDDWCFFCEFQTHVERANRSAQPFSPNNIILRLPNIGGNLGYGRQEDAHEFMRFAIDRMQLACLDEFGGEKAVRTPSRETTIIQHIFGGQLQSQVICTNCEIVSNQLENMMDLTVEIHGDAASLEECLDQFTKVEWLHGDNMYKCDGCNDYVKASKRLTIKQAPNILTIALKRFQSGRFGKLNKKVTFPETLDLSPYMSEASSSRSDNCSTGVCKATMSSPMFKPNPVSLPKLQSRDLVEKLEMGSGFKIPTFNSVTSQLDPVVAAKFYAVIEAIADRVEMHWNVGVQRDNWNRLVLTSLNAITLGAATMVGLAAAATTGAPIMALKISSTLLYLAATGMSVVMNKLQPSQLAEEQRNAARLFKQLHCQLQSKLSLGDLNNNQVDEAMEKVLALDRAYPLPLLGSMIEKLPTNVEPATWWPQRKTMQKPKHKQASTKLGGNGWSRALEDEMREIAGVLKRDQQEYLRLSQKALQINKILAVSGPLLTLLGAFGSVLVGSCSGTWPVILGVVAGSMASIANAMEHGGQVGMVFEMYRSNAGFFKLMEETIESNVNLRDVRRREKGEVLEMKVALQLGRSLSELRELAASNSSRRTEEMGEFASKLF